MLEQPQHKMISNEWAAFIGLILILIPTAYWILLAMSSLANVDFAYNILVMLPKNWWVVDFVIAIAAWKVNRMSIWIDRFGDWEGLIINKFIMNYCYFLIGVQIIFQIFKASTLKF